jgi:hypothetical protein
MRCLIAGVKDGQSCIIETISCDGGGPDAVIHELFEIATLPPQARPAGLGAFLDLGLPAGGLRWRLINFPPNLEYPTMHHTDSVDCNTVIRGKTDLILADGAHTLVAGDCAVVPGVDHTWKVGPEGCTVVYTLIGTPRRLI